MFNAIDKSPTQFPKPSAIMGKNGNKSQTSAMGDSLADPCLSNEDDFSMRDTQWKGGCYIKYVCFSCKTAYICWRNYYFYKFFWQSLRQHWTAIQMLSKRSMHLPKLLTTAKASVFRHLPKQEKLGHMLIPVIQTQQKQKKNRVTIGWNLIPKWTTQTLSGACRMKKMRKKWSRKCQQFKWRHQIYCLQKQPGAAPSLPMLALWKPHTGNWLCMASVGHCCTHSVHMQQMRLPMGMGQSTIFRNDAMGQFGFCCCNLVAQVQSKPSTH